MICSAVLASVALWPADAEAQRRGRRVYVRPAVFIGAQYGPYYPYSWYGYPYGRPYWYYRDYRSTLRIQNTPREAEVFVNGYFVGIVDDFDGWAQRLYLDPGEHEIAIYLEGYRTRRTPMLFRPGQSYRLSLGLEPLAAGDPPEARPTPSGPPPSRERDQRAAPAADLGTLSIRVQPADAVVLIDGERWDWPADSDRLIVEVPEGARRVEVRRDGHVPYETTVTIRRGETTTLNVSLRRND
jgi:hypothetical protein